MLICTGEYSSLALLMSSGVSIHNDENVDIMDELIP